MPAVYEAEIELYTDFIKKSHLSQKWHMAPNIHIAIKIYYQFYFGRFLDVGMLNKYTRIVIAC
jgi:hypothetical protein